MVSERRRKNSGSPIGGHRKRTISAYFDLDVSDVRLSFVFNSLLQYEILWDESLCSSLLYYFLNFVLVK